MKTCTSCNKVVSSNYVEFRCPKCGELKIVRCDICRNSCKQYTCKECGFQGP